MTDNEEVIEALEAKAEALDADLEDLGLVVKDEYEQTIEENDELREWTEAVEAENEELKEEVETVKDLYAEALADATGFSEESLKERFNVTELREEYERRVEEEDLDEIGASPEPRSGDPAEDPETDELSDEEEERVEALAKKYRRMSNREGWGKAATRAKDELTEILGDEERVEEVLN